MKKISKMLLKSYMILILIFTFSGIVIFITVEAYIKRSSADDLYAIDSFLQYETKEFKEKLESGRKINDIIDSALDEAPKILGSSIIFELNGQILSKSYSENELKQVENEDYYDIVKECGYYNLQYLKRKIKLLLYFMIFFINILAVEREIPHSIITENPKKDVTTIETLKKYKDKAELNITVTKLKTEEIPVEVDKNRKKLLLTLKGIEGKNIYPVENIEDIPNPNTSLGRRNINRMRVDNNLRTTRYDITTGEKRTKLEIDYKELPKNTYLAVTDKNFNLEKIYRANYRDYSAPRGNSVSVKLWLFGEEMGSLTNLIINPNNNSSGNIEIRKNGEFIFPESATEQNGLNTVFDIQGSPLVYDYEDSDYIELQNIGGAGSTSISNIQNSKGSFYRYRNEYAECSIPGYNLKTRIWSDSSKLEFTLRKNGTTNGYVKFKIVHKASDGTIRQEITVEMFINNKKFDSYFSVLTAYSRVYNFREISPSYDYNVGGYYYRIPINEGVVVSNLICDRLDYNIKTPASSNPITVVKTWGERAGQYLLQDYWNRIESYSQGFNEEAYYKKINAKVSSSYVKVYESYGAGNYRLEGC